MSKLLFLLLAVATLALGEAAYHGVRFLVARQDEELKRRLRQVGAPGAGVQLLRKRTSESSAILEALFGRTPWLQRLSNLLEAGDLSWTPSRFLGLTFIAALVGFLGGTIFLGPAIGVPIALATAPLPLAIAMRSRSARSRAVSRQLPDALEMMARSVRAGHALPSSFRLVATEMAPPVAVEFGKAYEEQNLGLPFDQAVASMARRVPGNTDLAIFAVSVLVQRETGGNLVENLESIASTIRERDRFYGKLRALTAEAKLGGKILGALPFFVSIMLSVLNPEYMAELTVGMGRLILAAGFTSWALGVAWMNKLAQVDY